MIGIPSHTGGHWTPRRLELLAWFRRNALSLGELYEGAVEMMLDSHLPGRSRFIAHAVREIRNRLPDVISGVKSGPRFEWKHRLDELQKAWENAGFSLDGSLPEPVTPTDKPIDLLSSDVRLPRNLFLKIAKILNDHSVVGEKPKEAAIRLFVGCVPENKQAQEALAPIIDQWIEVTNWFVYRTHDSGKPDGSRDWKVYTDQFLLFENTLVALLGKFFSTIEGLDEILEDANS